MFTIKKNNRKWEKRPQLYRGRFFYLKQASQIALFVFGLGVIVSVLIYFQKSDTLFIKHVEVLGKLKHIDKNEVIGLSGLTPADKLFSVNLRSITANIERFPWVKEARLRREFPDTIQIYIEERKAVALLKMKDFYYVGEDGKVFKKLQNDDELDLPVISGFDPDFSRNYPQLSKTYLKNVLSFLNYIQTQDFYKGNAVSEIRFDPVFGYTVYTLKDSLEIYYGRSNIELKHKKLETFAKSKHFDSAKFTRLDLDAKNKVVAREITL